MEISDTDEKMVNKNSRVSKVQTSNKPEMKNEENQGWLIDVLACVNSIKEPLFTLDDMYKFEQDLKSMHPQNNNIKAKIRQQLQFLRDKGVIEFLGKGYYRKIER